LPDRLVEEFDNTDCEEIRMADLKLPFNNLFLKFTPPHPLFLADGAPVDGCYIIKQGDEYLLTLTSQLEGVDYVRSISIACLDPTFSLHLPVPVIAAGNVPQCIPLSVSGPSKFCGVIKRLDDPARWFSLPSFADILGPERDKTGCVSNVQSR
jgi:hypothetical protein